VSMGWVSEKTTHPHFTREMVYYTLYYIIYIYIYIYGVGKGGLNGYKKL